MPETVGFPGLYFLAELEVVRVDPAEIELSHTLRLGLNTHVEDSWVRFLRTGRGAGGAERAEEDEYESEPFHRSLQK